MKRPVRSDFEAAVSEAGVTVTFKPTNAVYSFYRLAGSNDIARLGAVSPQSVRHAEPGGDTVDYASDEIQDEIQDMAQRIASEAGAAAWSVQAENETDKQTLRGYSIGGDDDVIE